jgi:hypothetical protein
MAVRDDRQTALGEEDFMPLPWGDALKHAPAVLALAALAIYAYLSICYDGFYRALGVDPGDVGLSYAAILARSSGFVIAASFLFLFFVPVLFPAPLPPPSRPRRYAAWVRRHQPTPEQRRRAEAVSRFVATLLILLVFLYVFELAEGAARDVKAGKPVRPVRPPVPGMSIPLTILAIHADPATVEPTGKPGASPAADRLRGRRLLYLGQAGGTIVLYDVAAQRAVYVPASAVILQVANCRGTPPDPVC